MNLPRPWLLLVPNLLLAACGSDGGGSALSDLNWAAATQVAQVDERYLSFNVEMVEVTGGRFWAPYDDPAQELYAYRAPIDLTNQRLRNLTKALAPAYMRVSGTWANSTYFDDSATPPQDPPQGYGSVLTAQQWDGVHHFARDLDLQVVTSFAASPGTRDANGVWTPTNAQKLLRYSKARDYKIVAAEFYNEATVSSLGGLPENYSATDFARDLALFKQLLAVEAPQLLLLGPSSVGEGLTVNIPFPIAPSSDDMLTATGPAFDAFAYHFYPALSQRCDYGFGQTLPEDALTDTFLRSAADNTLYYQRLRDQYLPGAPIWLTETGPAACGGNPWSSAFLDTFRYVEQLGDLARLGVQVNMHNTLAASDYALLDEEDFSPRPNYWASLLWQRTMGRQVLNIPQALAQENLDIYAHCQRNQNAGAVTLLLINRDAAVEKNLQLGLPYQRYTLTTPDVMSKVTELNGTALTVDDAGNVPTLVALEGNGGIALPPLSISFVEINADVAACKK